jgi:hypothetical protein
MRTGRNLQDLALEIERQAETKRDFIASTTMMDVKPIENGVAVAIGDKGEYPVGEIAHQQIATLTEIPTRYYDKMRRNAPDLLANNIRTWFNKYPATRLNRTLDARLRALLSDKYATFDNYDFAQAVLPVLSQRQLEVMSCEITEKRLYIKAVDKQLFRDVPVGYKMGDGSHKIFDTCAPALILANSEVGYGHLLAETGVYTAGCTNMALFAAGGMKRRHIGARHQLTDNMAVEDLDAILSTRTKQKIMEAVFLQVRDVVNSAFDEKVIAKRVEQMAEAANAKLPAARLEKVMEVVQERFNLNDGERNDVFKHLIEGGQLSQYGLHSAITRSAQDASDYDRATELEYLGGKVLELPRKDWELLAAE